MPIDASIPLRAVSGRRNNLVEEYAQAVNIKNAIAQQKAAEAEASRQENVRNALSKAVNPQTGEVDWNSAVNSVATVDPMTALSLRGELAKEQASGYDMKAKQIEYYTKAFDQAAQMAPTITDQAGWDSMRQWAYGIDPNLAERIPREFTPQNAQALAMTALDLKDRISIGQSDRTFNAQEAERQRQAARDAARDKFEGIPTAETQPTEPTNPEFYAWLTSVSQSLEDKFNLPRGSVEAMSEVESGHNPDAVSPTGVRGPMQVTEATGEGMNLDRNDPRQNTYAGAQLMGALWQKYNDPELVAAAYNSGEEAVDRALQWSKDTGAPWQQSGYVRQEGVNHGRKFAAAYQRVQERLAKGEISPKQAQEQTAKLMDKEVEQAFKEDEVPKATEKFTLLSDDEATAMGLDPKGKYQRNEAGKIDVVQAPPKAELSPKDINTANQKLIQINILKGQLVKLKESFAKIQDSWSAGLGTGGIPTEAGQIYDADVDAMRSLIQGLKRVPGVGSMSDYESRLEQAAIPSRSPTSTEARMARQIQNLEDLITGFETGYKDMLKDIAPVSATQSTETPPADMPAGVKITRTK